LNNSSNGGDDIMLTALLGEYGTSRQQLQPAVQYFEKHEPLAGPLK
jgi:hypothetical protein